jgi:hydroxypyruvate isomerase
VSLRFSANLSMLFTEIPFLDRFAAAQQAGFAAVEFWWPRDESLEAVVRAVEGAGVEVALFNFDAGDMRAGDRGLLSDPARQHEFRANVPVALELATELRCRRLNALVGVELPGVGKEAQLELARENVRWTADRAAGRGIDVLIEAVNTLESGPYLLSSTRAAAEFVRRVARPNVRLQYDAYHMQRMEGNLVATLAEYLHQIAHVQIADSPDRGQPGTGEINVAFVLERLEALGYDGFVGLEYRPLGVDTWGSLDWLRKAGILDSPSWAPTDRA